MIAMFEAMSYLGHEKHEWDPNKPGDFAKIREFFEEKLKAGFRAFIFGPDGKPVQVTKFDEEAERLVLVSPKSVMWAPNGGG